MDGDLGSDMVCALVAARNASVAARWARAPEGELADEARALLGTAVEDFLNRTGMPSNWVDAFMSDTRMGEEPLMHELLEVADATRCRILDVENGKLPELRRAEVKSMVQAVVRVVRSWCAARGLIAGEFDPRLNDPAFCK